MEHKNFLTTPVECPIWVTITEAAKLGGVENRTIRRAIKDKGEVKYKIERSKYMVEFKSLIWYLHKNTKLKNKLYRYGIGQYLDKWKE